MTNEQLNKGNELKNQIIELRDSIQGFKRCIKNLDIGNEYSIKSNFLKVSFENTSCFVRSEELIDFLWKELKNLEEELIIKEQELKDL